MSKRTLRGLIAVGSLIAVGPALPAEVVVATSVDDARQRVQEVADELDRLHERSDRLAEDYAVAVDEKGQLDEEVAEAETRVADMEAQLGELRDDLSTVAVRKFTGAGEDVLGPLFTDAEVYSETLQRDQFSRVALSVGTTTTNDFEELVRELDDERATLERKRAEAETLAEQLEGQLEEAEQLRAEYQERRAAAEAELGQALAAEEQRRLEEAQRRMQAEAAEAAAQADASSSGGSGGGGSGGGGSGDGGSGDGGSGDGGSGDGGSGGGGSGDGGSSSGGASSTPAPAPAPAPDVPAPSSLSQVAIQAALSQQGVPYKFATSQPGVAFDCSGLTHYAWGQAGVSLPRNSRAQAGMLPRVSASQAQPGDLIFYYSPISHVGIYLGNGQLVHAPNTGSVVNIATVNWSRVTAVGRPG
ncbi:MAG: NlpC/P60 family protein [Ilumatobacteraceae bacterium]